ncbi:MAG: biotin--[acetyl-CoA-carboxylase] ligase [Defluviitaleaceae bacterium]|nr:biotin--[acetyl-CoA-carboxylase] ligase [Defluviitaleaceae bacterium]
MEIIVLNEVDSTNTALKEMLRDGTASAGAVVYSENQKSGYGRRGRFWHSEKGKNIAVSLALQPFKGDDLISLATGVAVLQSLYDEYGIHFSLKWPNDILYKGKKVCGISCEKIATANGQVIVLGIGINVNNTVFPEGMSDTATSIHLALRDYAPKESEITLRGLLDNLLDSIFHWHDRLSSGFTDEVLSAVKTACINIGQPVRIVNEGVTVAEGIAEGIDADGGIIVITDNNTPKKFHSGEISLR